MADLSDLLGVTLLAAAFPLAGWSARFTSRIGRRWRSLSAGVAAAFMFVSVLPELAEHQPTLAAVAHGSILNAEKRIYSWALFGFVSFAGLSEFGGAVAEGRRARRPGLFYSGRIVGFAIYVLLISYLLSHREDDSLLSLGLYVAAMGLHFFMLDVVLSEQFGRLYEPMGRMLLVGAVILGWWLGNLHLIPDGLTSRLFAFILGGVTITSAHEEMGAGKGAYFWWFCGGAAGYAVLLMLT